MDESIQALQRLGHGDSPANKYGKRIEEMMKDR